MTISSPPGTAMSLTRMPCSTPRSDVSDGPTTPTASPSACNTPGASLTALAAASATTVDRREKVVFRPSVAVPARWRTCCTMPGSRASTFSTKFGPSPVALASRRSTSSFSTKLGPRPLTCASSFSAKCFPSDLSSSIPLRIACGQSQRQSARCAKATGALGRDTWKTREREEKKETWAKAPVSGPSSHAAPASQMPPPKHPPPNDQNSRRTRLDFGGPA